MHSSARLRSCASRIWSRHISSFLPQSVSALMHSSMNPTSLVVNLLTSAKTVGFPPARAGMRGGCLDGACEFRTMSAGDFGARRPPVSEHAGRSFRSKPATFKVSPKWVAGIAETGGRHDRNPHFVLEVVGEKVHFLDRPRDHERQHEAGKQQQNKTHKRVREDDRGR